MTSTYPSFTSLLGVTSASEFFPDDDTIRSGYVSHRTKSVTTTTYLWKIENVLSLIRRRHSVFSPLFQGPQATTWRFQIDWGDGRMDNSQRYVKLTLTFVGNIQSQLRFQAGYEIFKGEDDFKRGHIDLDGSEYKLQMQIGEGAHSQINWTHHKNLAQILESSLEQNGALYVGVTVAFIPSQSRTDFRPPMTLKNNLPDIPGPQDLILLGKNGLKIPAHKSYLSTWSSALRDRINALTAPETLDFSQYHGQTLKSLIDFLYLGDLNESTVQGHAVELLRLTDELNLFMLQPRICDYLTRNIWREGLLKTFIVADAKPTDENYLQLRNSAAALIRQNMATIFELHLNDEDLSREELFTVKKRVVELSASLPSSQHSLSSTQSHQQLQDTLP